MISFSFTACLERDAQRKQVRRYTPWTPPEGTYPFQSQKSGRADRRRLGERNQDGVSEGEGSRGRSDMPPPEKRHDDFVSFVYETWSPLQAQGNNRKAKTVSFYSRKYEGRFGRPLTPKTVHHQYNTLNLIFNFAIEINPSARLATIQTAQSNIPWAGRRKTGFAAPVR